MKIPPAFIGLMIEIGCDRLYDYCRQDVEVEREFFDRLPPLSPAEQRSVALSCRINDRGFLVDRQFAEAARRIAQAAAPEIDAELAEITGGAVTGINQVARLLQWLQEQGCTVQKLDRKAIERQLEQRKSCRRRCGACSSFGSAARRPPSRRSMRCSLVPATTIVCAALPLSRRRHRPLGRRRIPAAEPEAPGRRGSRRRDRRGRDRRLRARARALSAAAVRGRRLQPRDDRRGTRSRVDRRRFQQHRKPRPGLGCRRRVEA